MYELLNAQLYCLLDAIEANVGTLEIYESPVHGLENTHVPAVEGLKSEGGEDMFAGCGVEGVKGGRGTDKRAEGRNVGTCVEQHHLYLVR